MTEVFLMQKIKKWRHWHLGSIFPHSGGKAHLQLFSSARKKSNLWSLHHFPETFIEYSASWRNETAILKSWLLQTVTFFFSAFLTILFPNAFSTETPQMQTETVVSLVPELAQNITLPSITVFWDHYFQQIRVLNLVWRLKGKLNGPIKYYHKTLLTIFLYFKWSLNYGITRHYAKNPILFEQSHYPTFCLLWFS